MSQPLGTTIQRRSPVPLSPGGQHAQNVLESQTRITPFPYYSTIQFTAPAVGAAPGPFTYTIPTGTTARAFSYGIDQSPATAIPRLTAVGGIGTRCETNILERSRTISGQNVYISGISLQIKHGSLPSDGNFSDARLAAQLDTNAHVSLSLNGGQQVFQLGPTGCIPGSGGLTGSGYDSTGRQPLQGGNAEFGFFNNGWETRSNFMRLPEGLIWRAQGESNSDSNLEIPMTTCRDITLVSGGDPANREANVDAATDPCCVQGHVYPDQIECNYMVFLTGWVIGARSQAV